MADASPSRCAAIPAFVMRSAPSLIVRVRNGEDPLPSASWSCLIVTVIAVGDFSNVKLPVSVWPNAVSDTSVPDTSTDFAARSPVRWPWSC